MHRVVVYDEECALEIAQGNNDFGCRQRVISCKKFLCWLSCLEFNEQWQRPYQSVNLLNYKPHIQKRFERAKLINQIMDLDLLSAN